jgi:hypothetical protein
MKIHSSKVKLPHDQLSKRLVIYFLGLFNLYIDVEFLHQLEGHGHVLQKVHLQVVAIDSSSITCHVTLVHLLEGKILFLNMFSPDVDPIEY